MTWHKHSTTTRTHRHVVDVFDRAHLEDWSVLLLDATKELVSFDILVSSIGRYRNLTGEIKWLEIAGVNPGSPSQLDIR
jgi:hypothetical protein